MSLLSGTLELPKCQNDTLDVTLEESQVLSLLQKDCKLTQKKLSETTGISERTIKRITVSLETKGIIKREGGRRYGHWIIIKG